METSLQNAKGHLQPLLWLSYPETHAQVECTNQTLEQYLRCFLSYQQDDWAEILHFAKFSYNNSIHSSTRVTPFYAYTCHHPRSCVLETPKLPTNPSVENLPTYIKP